MTLPVAAFARFVVQSGEGARFEAVFADLARAMRAGEPGLVHVTLARSRSEADVYHVLEVYADDAALAAHGAAAHCAEAVPRLMALLAGDPSVAMSDVLV